MVSYTVSLNFPRFRARNEEAINRIMKKLK